MNKVRVPLSTLKMITDQWEDGVTISVTTEKGNVIRLKGMRSSFDNSPLVEIAINPDD